MYEKLNKSQQQSSRPLPLPSWSLTLLHWCRNPGRKQESHCHHANSDKYAICGCHRIARGPPSRTTSGAAGYAEWPGAPLPSHHPGATGGPRNVPELDGPGGSGRNSSSADPTPPPAAEQDGDAGWPRSLLRSLRENRGSRWVAKRTVAGASDTAVVRGSAGGCSATARAEPPAGRPKARATSPAIPFAGPGREWPTLRDGTTAPGLMPQMAAGWGKRRRAHHRPGGTGAVHHSSAKEDGRVGPVPPTDVAELSHPTGGGSDGGVPRGRRTPSSCLSLLAFVFSFSPSICS